MSRRSRRAIAASAAGEGREPLLDAGAPGPLETAGAVAILSSSFAVLVLQGSIALGAGPPAGRRRPAAPHQIQRLRVMTSGIWLPPGGRSWRRPPTRGIRETFA